MSQDEFAGMGPREKLAKKVIDAQKKVAEGEMSREQFEDFFQDKVEDFLKEDSPDTQAVDQTSPDEKARDYGSMSQSEFAKEMYDSYYKTLKNFRRTRSRSIISFSVGMSLGILITILLLAIF